MPDISDALKGIAQFRVLIAELQTLPQAPVYYVVAFRALVLRTVLAFAESMPVPESFVAYMASGGYPREEAEAMYRTTISFALRNRESETPAAEPQKELA